MSLSQFKPLTKTVDVPGHGFSIEIRGLNFNDLTILIQNHRETIEKLFEDYNDTEASAESLLSGLLTKSPRFCAEVIALACDEPESVGNAEKLPLNVQLDALITVGQMTFEEAGGVKKFFEQVVVVIKGVTGVMEKLPASQMPTLQPRTAKQANTGTSD